MIHEDDGARAGPAAAPRAGTGLDGAPLDLVKLIAAIVMVVDHVNTILLGHEANALWYLGRVAYPWFGLALACHLQRGTPPARYAPALLLLAIASQPIYGAAFGGGEASPIATLALAAITIVALRPCDLWLQHLVFAAGSAALLAPWLQARSGVDFGLAGILFPAALFLVMAGRRSHTVWLAVMLLMLNWHRPEAIVSHQTVLAALSAALGSAVVVALAGVVKGRPRFLPRYALHVFYPGHLAILIAIRAAL